MVVTFKTGRISLDSILVWVFLITLIGANMFFLLWGVQQLEFNDGLLTFLGAISAVPGSLLVAWIVYMWQRRDEEPKRLKKRMALIIQLDNAITNGILGIQDLNKDLRAVALGVRITVHSPLELLLPEAIEVGSGLDNFIIDISTKIGDLLSECTIDIRPKSGTQDDLKIRESSALSLKVRVIKALTIARNDLNQMRGQCISDLKKQASLSH